MEQCQLCSAHDSSLNCVAPDTHNTGNMSETSQLSGLRGRDSWRKEKKKRKKKIQPNKDVEGSLPHLTSRDFQQN